MLSKKHRATTATVVKTITHGKTRSAPHFSVRALSNSSPVTAVVVSKKVSPKAVIRNTLKRRIRAAIQPLKFSKDTTFVIYVKKGVEDLTISEIQKELQELLI
ncbi:ribonuclease P protein component [Candidatus Kaiserbacteria bacterium]|nr:MAG: ribonuclease P protein component [Candidatus Kaiserbacteria bacterium]